MGKSFSKSQFQSNKEEKKQNAKNQSRESNGASSKRKSRKKLYLQQMKQDRKSQRVTKEQMYKLANELKGTAWYLGRRLEFTEAEIKKILWLTPTELAAKRVILITWRKKNGWKATNQSLVILLELAGYEVEQYKCILPQQENGHTNIYNKIDKTQPKTTKSNGYFRYDSHIDLPKGNNDKRNYVQKNVHSSVAAGTDDIIEFARRSWKKPSRKQNGQPKSKAAPVEPQTARDSKTVPSIKLKQRSRSDSKMDKAYDSESELDAVFRKPSDDSVALSRRRCRPPESNKLMATHHEHTISTESQTEEYRKQLIRMSRRQFTTSQKDDEEEASVSNGDEAVDFGSYQFALLSRSPEEASEQHISGLVVTHDDKIVVAESNNKEIQVFEKFGNFLTSFLTQSELNPKGMAVNNRNEIVVCCGKDVRLFTTSGEMLRIFGRGSFRNNSYSVVCDAIGNYYVSDIVGHTISVFDSDGNIRKRFGDFGDSLINFNQPVALAINERKKLFISDSQNHCVKVYSLAGRPIEHIGERGSTEGSFWNPFGVCFDKRGQLLVADCGNNRISLFDASYKFLRHVLTEEDGLAMPSLIRVTSTGQLIVCEWKSNYVKVFSFETSV